MKTKLNRILSLLLSIALMISLLPAIPVFAAAEAQVITPDGSTLIQNNATYYTSSVADGVLKITAQCRAMMDNTRNSNTAYVAIPFTAATSGDFNLYLKSDDPTVTSADAAIFIVENTGSTACSASGCSSPSSMTDNKAKPCYFLDDVYADAYANVFGRFNFSTAQKDTYQPVLKGENASEISLTEGKNYYFVLYCDSESLKNSPIGLSTHSNQESYPNGRNVYEYYVKKGESVKSAYKQTISLSGIKLVPAGQSPDEGEDEEEESLLSFPQKLLHVGDTLAISGVPAGATLSVAPEGVLTVAQNGEVTGVAMGKATVTVSAGGKNHTIEIPVVGENRISTAPGKSGDDYFRNGIYDDGGLGTTTEESDTIWIFGGTKATSEITSTLESFTDMPGRTSAVHGLKTVTNGTRFYITTSDDKAKSGDGINTTRNEKIYEFTGWIKLDKTSENNLPAPATVLAGISTAWKKGTTQNAHIKTAAVWNDGDYEVTDSTTGWKMFATPSVLQYRSNMDLTDGNDTVGMVPRLNVNSTSVANTALTGYFTEFSLHEVVLDRIELSHDRVDLSTDGETSATVSVINTYSNTGRKIESINQTSVKGTPTYKSNNTAVATVDDAGVITAVAAGSTTIEVSTTIGNVTKTATVDVVVTGGTTPEPGPGTDPEPEPEPEPEPDPEPDGVAVPDAPIEGLPEYQGEPIVYNMTSGAFDLAKMYKATAKDTNNYYVFGDSGETVNRTWVDGRVGSSLIRNQGIASWKPCITTNAQGEKVEAFSAMKETEPKWAIEHPTKYLYKDGAQNYLASCLNPQVNTNYVRLDLVEKYWNEPNNGKHKEAPGPYLAVRLLVENAGRYSLSIGRGTTSDTGVRTHVHMIKADPNKRYEADEIDGLLKEAKYVGIHSSLKGDPKEITSVTDFWVNVPEAGEYLLVFTPSKDSNAGTSLCYLNTITLGPIIRTLTKVAVTAEKPNLFHGETTTLDYALFNNDDTPYVGESSVYWYESSDPSVASVSQDGVVTAHNAGKADIILYVESAGIEVKGSVSVTVADNTPLAWAEIIGSESVEAGFTGSLSYRAGHVSGSPANPDVCTVSYRLANTEDEKYLKVNSQTGVITGVSECDSVTVIATVTCGEYTIDSDPFEIKVTPNSPKSKLIDFRKPGSGYASDVMIDEYGWRINAAKTSSDVSAPSSSKLRCYSQGTHAQITSVGQTQNADLAIDIQVDYDGWYEIDFLGTQYYRGAKNANLYMDGAFMGNFCFWTDMSTNRNYNALKSLNTMYLTRGVHTIIFRAMTKSPEGNYSHMIPAYLQLSYVEGVGGLESVGLSAEKTSMAAGETTTVTPKVILGGGREYSFGNKHGNKADPDNNITFSSSDSNVVSVSGSKLTAIAPGNATITATAKIGDDTLSNTIDITVTGDTLSRVEFVHPQYDIFVNGSGAPAVNAYLSNGRKIDSGDISVEYIIEDTSVAVMESKTKLVGKTVGSTTIKAKVTFNGNDYFSEPIPLNVIEYGFASLTLGAVTQVIKAGGKGTELYLRAYDNDGKSLPIPAGAAVYSSADENVLTVDGNGRVTPVDVGVTDVTVTVTLDGVPRSEKITISVRDGKVASTYYTKEKIDAARENIKLYDWAKTTAESVIEEADGYLPHLDYIYNMITAHTLPRAFDLVETEDPMIWRCFYCGVDLNYKYGKYAWNIDTINRPWKIQCPDCKRLFPSNDFGAYYERGLDEHGEFDYTLAREENGILCGRGERNEKGEYVVFDWAKDNPYGYGDPKGNLYNATYNELREKPIDPFYGDKITQGWGDFKTGGDSRVPNTGYFWGVDDGFGYDTGRYNTSSEGAKIKNVHRYIAVFNHDGLWYGSDKDQLIYRSVQAFRDAYLYTGDKKYARAGAIILDRVADLYPYFDYKTDCPDLQSSTDGGGNGKVVGRIWENFLNRELTTAYDAFFDIYDDPEVVSVLSGYAEKWNLDNKKTNGELIRQNAEDNIIYETYTAIKNAKLAGNFGLKQHNLAKAAVILDRDPDTQEMIEFVMQPGATSQTKCTGGGMRPALFNQIDRDGYADESSMGYMSMWVSNFIPYIDALENWDGLRDEDNLRKNPKFIKMLYMGLDLILAGVRGANIGDSSATFAGVSFPTYTSSWLEGLRLTGDPMFAQLLWHTNQGKTDGIHYGIFVKDPESPQEQIKQLVEQYGEYNFSESSIATGYGFAALRDGVMYDKVTNPTQTNTMRDWWMYFGGAATTHKHKDALNLGLDAFGLNMAPDLGYFSSSGGAGTTQGENWTESTISHNTVVVNDKAQARIKKTGFPYHFEDAGSIKIMDADAPNAYSGVTDIYRRTVVSIDVDDTVSYALDFFRIKGGDEHVYSFHSQSEESVVTGVNMAAQPRGSYAGIDVPFGEEVKYTATNGYNWLANVERAVEPGTGEFSIDFKIKDYRKTLKGKRNLHLKLTQLNDFNISEVAVADGQPVQRDMNPEWTDYLLVRRSGKNLDTLFTSVIEPYEDSSKISSLTRVPVKHADGTEVGRNETVAAIKVELTNGRVDYVVYAANNETAYRIDNLFDFEGFVGVYSVAADDNTDVVRTYLHDGKTLGEAIQNKDAAITGKIVSFTDTLSLDNFMEVTYNEEIAPEELVGRMIVIENDGGQNGAYIIKSAEKAKDNIRIGTGDVSYFRSLTEDGSDYVMNFAVDDTYRIPLTYTTDAAPEISVSGEYTTSAGSSINIPLNVTSDREYTLAGTTLPRGMSLNSETGVLTWKPDSSQVGDNHVAVTVDNGVMSDTVHFIVTVYGSTTGNTSSDKTENSGTGTTATPAGGGGGGGGGGGAAPTDKPDDETKTDESDTSDKTDEDESLLLEEKVPSVGEADEVEKPQFTDLGNHAWAEDAINTLATAGIIKGTSASTFSPANNITRADFALLLVRAFKLESENTENFADVSANDYFAPELAIARNSGIVNGIGDNKFAPRNTITRQDMMVIVYRALQKLDVKFDIYDEPNYEDFGTVADYAREAVTALIGADLVNGKNNRIAPTDYTTRAEVAVLIKRILDYIK